MAGTQSSWMDLWLELAGLLDGEEQVRSGEDEVVKGNEFPSISVTYSRSTKHQHANARRAQSNNTSGHSGLCGLKPFQLSIKSKDN
jgi:hypothetical protein